ncbi:MAG: hypothetical protein KC492_21420 [Myxococcales bacterium]|nr:hypothetical protein [Myxococcales bacterium]
MYTVSTQALMHGTAAAAGKQLKPGFAIGPEEDLLFALAFPRLGYIADGHPNEEASDDFDTWQQRTTTLLYHGQNSLTPRAVAFRRLRMLGCKEPYVGREYSDEYRAALTNPEPVDVESAKAFMATYIESNLTVQFGPLYMFEALFGPDATLDAVVPLIEASDPNKLHDRKLNYYASGLAPVLRRASEKAAKSATTKLEKAFAKSTEDARAQPQSVARGIGMAIGGAEFAEKYARRTNGPVDQIYLEWCEDNPEFVRSQLVDAPVVVPYVSYPRLVFIAGDAVWPRYRAVAAKQKDAESHAEAVALYGLIKSEGAARMLCWLATKSKAKAAAAQWIQEHQDVFLEFVERIAAGSDDDAKHAQAVVKQLSKGKKGKK